MTRIFCRSLLICLSSQLPCPVSSRRQWQASQKLTLSMDRPIDVCSTGRPWGYGSKTMLELKTERNLPRTVAGTFCGLCCGKRAERGGRADVCCRRSEVRVIQYIGEGRFETEVRAFGDGYHLGQTGVHRDGAGPFKTTDACITDSSRTRRRRREGINVEVIRIRAVSRDRIADAIRANDRHIR